MRIRAADPTRDAAAIAAIIVPTIRAGETFALDRDQPEADAVAAWLGGDHEAFVAEDDDGAMLGTYYLRPNQAGGGAHVANAGYATGAAATGRGVARAMATHSIVRARERGFRAIQFNFVVSTNAPAVHLWQALGWKIVGRLPGAFAHPTHGDVDALVMFQAL
jgi:ribosomal protein S18 acetylase RimI-like enzyme